MKRKIVVTVPATTANLGSGFDSFGAALELRNTIEVEVLPAATPRSANPEIIVEGAGEGILPRGPSNLVWRAMKKVFAAARLKKIPRIRLTMKNKIPLSSGLGSSAAAVVGGLLAASKICYNKLPEKELIKIAVGLEGHPDNAVPAFAGGFCVSFLDGKDPDYIRFDMPAAEFRAAVCVPGINFPTNEARGILPSKVSLDDAVFNLSRAAIFVASVAKRDWRLIGKAVEDRLHQNRRMSRIPGAAEAFRAASTAGRARAVCVSGAGPSIIALCPPSAAKWAAALMRQAFARAGVKSETFVLKFTNTGASVEEK